MRGISNVISATRRLARTVLPLFVLTMAFATLVYARTELPELRSALGYELGDSLIPEKSTQDDDPSPFQNLWEQSSRWTDELWLRSQRGGRWCPRPVSSWDDAFNQDVCLHVAFRLRRGMATAEVGRLLDGYWHERCTNVVNGPIGFQRTSRQEEVYLLDVSRLSVRFEDGLVCGFELREWRHRSWNEEFR